MPKLASGVSGQSLAANSENQEQVLQLQQQLREMEILLSLNSDIVALKSKENILPLILPKLKSLFQTEDIFICRLHSESDRLHPFLRAAAIERQEGSPFSTLLNQRFPIQDPFIKAILQAHEPVVYQIESFFDDHTADYLLAAREAGIRSSLSVTLQNADQLLGVLTLWSENENGFTRHHQQLLAQVAKQISLVVANILDHEKIQEKENEILLSISHAIASIRDKNDLIRAIQQTLRSTIPFSDIAITRFDLNKGTFRVFLEYCEQTSQHPDFNQIAFDEYPIADGIHDRIMNSNGAVVLAIESLSDKAMPHIDFLLQAGIRELAGIRLRHNDKIIGTMTLLSTQQDAFPTASRRIIEEASHHFATAMVNIVANERIENQLKEISHYKEQLEQEKQYLQEEVRSNYSHFDMIGNSREMQALFQQLSQVAGANTTVLILGETGTGKELIARAIHNSSPRRQQLMVKINCAALPPHLVESELFGHEKGSFTGATERRIGKFERANKGTLFLDEVGELPLELQVKLLRAIQEKEIERIGGKSTIKVDVRIIAATNRDLQKEMLNGKFRQDLFYRLNVFPVTVPPLRNRTSDIPALVAHFVDKYAKNSGKNITGVSAKVMKELLAYNWPGNVRELEHLIERSVLLTNSTSIRAVLLPSERKNNWKNPADETVLRTYEENEREHIIQVLNRCNGKIFGAGGAAAILQLPVSTLNSKIKKLGIRKGKLFSAPGTPDSQAD